MSRQYPRIGAIEKRPKNTTAKCACGDVATRRAHVQVNYFRGDDDVVWVCEKQECLDRTEGKEK